jgi:hypothetical protein
LSSVPIFTVLSKQTATVEREEIFRLVMECRKAVVKSTSNLWRPSSSCCIGAPIWCSSVLAGRESNWKEKGCFCVLFSCSPLQPAAVPPGGMYIYLYDAVSLCKRRGVRWKCPEIVLCLLPPTASNPFFDFSVPNLSLLWKVDLWSFCGV